MSHKQKEPRAAAQFAKQFVQGDSAIVPSQADGVLDTFDHSASPPLPPAYWSKAESSFNRGLMKGAIPGARENRRQMARLIRREQKRLARAGGAA